MLLIIFTTIGIVFRRWYLGFVERHFAGIKRIRALRIWGALIYICVVRITSPSKRRTSSQPCRKPSEPFLQPSEPSLHPYLLPS